jgi:hypothetical protein
MTPVKKLVHTSNAALVSGVLVFIITIIMFLITWLVYDAAL